MTALLMCGKTFSGRVEEPTLAGTFGTNPRAAESRSDCIAVIILLHSSMTLALFAANSQRGVAPRRATTTTIGV